MLVPAPPSSGREGLCRIGKEYEVSAGTIRRFFLWFVREVEVLQVTLSRICRIDFARIPFLIRGMPGPFGAVVVSAKGSGKLNYFRRDKNVT